MAYGFCTAADRCRAAAQTCSSTSLTPTPAWATTGSSDGSCTNSSTRRRCGCISATSRASLAHRRRVARMPAISPISRAAFLCSRQRGDISTLRFRLRMIMRYLGRTNKCIVLKCGDLCRNQSCAAQQRLHLAQMQPQPCKASGAAVFTCDATKGP